MKAPAGQGSGVACRTTHDRPIIDFATLNARLQVARSALNQSFADGTLFLALIAIALWALTHPYQGIFGDANVYIGRALADLDPSGVGRDLMFVHDEQSRFSLFPILTDRLVAAFGTNTTALLIATLSMAAWIAALCALARQFVAPRFVFIVVIFVALLPDAYGYPERFHFSEANAIPRPFAEALVLVALAALAAQRSRIAFLTLIAASLIHPIMALAGWGIFAFVLCCEDWRWRVAAIIAVVLICAGAFFGAPLLGHLSTFMDPDLKAFAESRSPHLFPTHWPIESIGPLVVQAATILVAASFFFGRRKLILLAAIAAGIGGIAVQALFGDYVSLLLIIQAQPWRTAWLLSAMGAVALAIAALELWRQGPRGHIVLALLATAWLCSEEPLSAAMICALALFLHFKAQMLSFSVTWTLARIVWAGFALLVVVYSVGYFIGYHSFIAAIPLGGPPPINYLWNERTFVFPILALALAWALQPSPGRLTWAAEGAAAFLLIIGAVYFWDARTPMQRIVESNTHPPDLMQRIASRSGEVLWVDGLGEAWFLTGRPQWASPQQGVSMVFSRDLALEWRARMRFLVANGLADTHVLSSAHVLAAADLPKLPREGIARLCARDDAPAWIIAPVRDDTALAPELKPTYWHPPVANFELTETPAAYVWSRISAYAVLPCAGT